MAMMDELEKQVGLAEQELQGALQRLRSFAELEASMSAATAGIKEGGEGLSKLSEHLGDTNTQLTDALGEFRGALQALNDASPESVVDGLQQVRVSTAQAAKELQANQASLQSSFQAAMDERIQSMESRVAGVESQLEQLRATLGQVQTKLQAEVREVEESARRAAGSVRPWVILTFLIVVAIGVVVGMPFVEQLQAGASSQ